MEVAGPAAAKAAAVRGEAVTEGVGLAAADSMAVVREVAVMAAAPV